MHSLGARRARCQALAVSQALLSSPSPASLGSLSRSCPASSISSHQGSSSDLSASHSPSAGPSFSAAIPRRTFNSTSNRSRAPIRPRRNDISIDELREQIAYKVLCRSGMDLDAIQRIRTEDHHQYVALPREQRHEFRFRIPPQDTGWKRSGPPWRTRRTALPIHPSSSSKGTSSGGQRDLHSRASSSSSSSSSASRPARIKVRQRKGKETERFDSETRVNFSAGDFIEIRLGASTDHGIVLQPSPEALRASPIRKPENTSVFFLSSTGQVSVRQQEEVTFQISDLLPQDDDTKELLRRASLNTKELLELTKASDALESTRVDFIPGKGMQLPAHSSAVAPPLDKASISPSTRRQATKSDFIDEATQRQLDARNELLVVARNFVLDTERLYDPYRRRLLHLMSNASFWEHRREISSIELARFFEQTAEDDVDPVSFSHISDRPPSLVGMFATHQLLSIEPLWFALEKTNRQSNTFRIKHAAGREQLSQVSAWIEQDRQGKHGPVSRFVAKVGQILRSSDEQSAAREKWSREDMKILSVLLDGISIGRQLQQDVYVAPLAYFMQQFDQLKVTEPQLVDTYDPLRDWGKGSTLRGHEQIRQIFIKLGFWPEDSVDWSFADERSRNVLENIMLRESKESEQQEKKDAAPSVAGQSVGALHSKDFDEGLRTDYDGTVYVIDDESAFELDDGISVDPLDDGKRFWVHIHIADPTSSIMPNDELARRASEQTQSIYTYNGRLPMLPDSVPGIASKDKVVDGSAANSGRALTFSVLLNDRGLAEDFDIGCRHLKTVKVMTYDKVDAILKDGNQAASPKEEQELRTLARVAALLRDERFRNGAFLTNNVESKVSMYDKKGNTVTLPFSLPSPYTLANPSMGNHLNALAGLKPNAKMPRDIELTLQLTASGQRLGFSEDSSRTVVSEFMILAGQTAASFAARAFSEGGQKIPLPFRGQRIAPSQIETWNSLVEEAKSNGGVVSYQRAVQSDLIIPVAEVSHRPLGHATLGIKGHGRRPSPDADSTAINWYGYAQSTSPLRRHMDMVVHWQIKAALHARDQKRGNTRVARNLLDESAMAELVPALARRAAVAGQVSKLSDRYWATKALRIALERAQAGVKDEDLPILKQIGEPADSQDTFIVKPSFFHRSHKAYVLYPEVRLEPSTLTTFTRVRIPSLGMDADCYWPLQYKSIEGVYQDGRGRPALLPDMPQPGVEVDVRIVRVQEDIHGSSIKCVPA